MWRYSFWRVGQRYADYVIVELLYVLEALHSLRCIQIAPAVHVVHMNRYAHGESL